MSGAESSYIHGTAPEEQARLSSMNDLINRSSLRELALREGERVLDVGAGLCQLTRAMARATRRPVVGLERSAEQIAEARRQAQAAGEAGLLDLRQGEATALPLAAGERGAFDVAHARFLLEHVRTPDSVVAAMARAVRPGGRVVIADDDHDQLRLWPEPAYFETVWRAYARSYDRNGCDPIVGRRLVQLLAGAGLRPRRIGVLPFGACAGQAEFGPLVRNIAVIFEGAREAILGTGGATAAGFEAALTALEAFGRRDDAAIWYGAPWAEGVRP